MYLCDECGKGLQSEGGLAIHMEMAHAPEPPPPPPPASADERVAMVGIAPARRQVAPPAPAPAPDDRERRDPTFAVAVALVIALLLGGVAAAIHGPRPAEYVTVASSAAPLLPAPTPIGAEVAEVRAPSVVPTPGGCGAAIDGMSDQPSARNADVAELVRTGGIGPLPVPGHDRPEVLNQEQYTGTEDFLSHLMVADPDEWREAMEDAAFQQSDHADYAVAGSAFSAASYRFASPRGAMEFQRATLRSFCDAGLMNDAASIDGVPGGLAYIDMRVGVPRFAATFVAGDTVVRLRVCECVAVDDDFAVVAEWARVSSRQAGAVSQSPG